jgi:S-adenosylmethionine:tRNA ribosyltransferase-isomerase
MPASPPVSPEPQATSQAAAPAVLTPRAPLERSGHRRDEARLLVGWRSDGRMGEARMADLPAFASPGDVIVVNASATLPAAVAVNDELVVHLSTHLTGDLEAPAPTASTWMSTWVVEFRRRCGHGTTAWRGYRPGGPIRLPGDGRLEIIEPYPPALRPDQPTRLWTARLSLRLPPHDYLARFGRPIRYGCDGRPWGITDYQTIFAAEPGSAEMPSAARGFTTELVTELVSRGVIVVPIVLHTGVSSQDGGEPPYPERYHVPRATADAINSAHAVGGREPGGRVIAVGTTATRAIETVAGIDGTVQPGEGWTDLVITSERGVRAVDGLLTGWHEPEASHVELVAAVAGRDLLEASYARAIQAGFHGHEFGDFHLILP